MYPLTHLAWTSNQTGRCQTASWVQCFRMYAALLCSSYPNKVQELYAYETMIVREVRRCGEKTGYHMIKCSTSKQLTGQSWIQLPLCDHLPTATEWEREDRSYVKRLLASILATRLSVHTVVHGYPSLHWLSRNKLSLFYQCYLQPTPLPEELQKAIIHHCPNWTLKTHKFWFSCILLKV